MSSNVRPAVSVVDFFFSLHDALDYFQLFNVGNYHESIRSYLFTVRLTKQLLTSFRVQPWCDNRPIHEQGSCFFFLLLLLSFSVLVVW